MLGIDGVGDPEVTLDSAAADHTKADVSPGSFQKPKNRVERFVHGFHIPAGFRRRPWRASKHARALPPQADEIYIGHISGQSESIFRFCPRG
jgi:hypothetical protein